MSETETSRELKETDGEAVGTAKDHEEKEVHVR